MVYVVLDFMYKIRRWEPEKFDFRVKLLKKSAEKLVKKSNRTKQVFAATFDDFSKEKAKTGDSSIIITRSSTLIK